MTDSFVSEAFAESQRRQRECLATPTGFDWSQIDLEGVAKAVGKVINCRLVSYRFPGGILVKTEF